MTSGEWRDFGALNGPVLLFGGPYSNLQATKALQAEAAARGIAPGHVICTGDIVAYCGSPAETVAAIRDWGCCAIAGNCELQLAAGAGDCGCGFDPGSVCDALSEEWFAYSSALIDEPTRAWMGRAPQHGLFTHAGRRYAVVHGGAKDVSRFIWPGDDELVFADEFEALEAEFGPLDGVVAGHCGIAFTREISARIWINAGVIGMPPNDGRPETGFAILEDGVATHHRLSYDATAATAAMADRRSPYAESLISGWWPSEDVLPPSLRRDA